MLKNREHFIDLWTTVAIAYPEHLALEEKGHHITYKDLLKKVKSLASVLTHKGYPNNSPILVDIDKSSDYIIAILAVWWSGHYFIPVSSGLPKERKRFITAQTKPVCVLVKENIQDSELPVIQVNATTNKLVTPSLNTDNIAYIYFTSGSTGKPKGVVLSHRGLSNVLKQQIELFELDSNTRSLLYLSTLFDASLSDIGTALLSGGCLVIPQISSLNSPEKIADYLIDKQITYVDIPPVVLGLIDSNMAFPKLKTIVVGGEAIAAKTIHQWSDKVKLVVVYGPTEATICTSMICCTSTDWSQNFIGVPINGVEYFLDNTGELLIAGDCIAVGYLNNPQLTESKFVQKSGKRYYRTGDRVFKDDFGNYIFKGRIDRQFKANGKLIAPEEIETVIKNVDGVKNAVVVKDGTRVIALIESENGAIKLPQIKELIAKHLPSWMMPSRFVFNQKVATTVTGKTNVNIPFENKTLQRLRAYWCDVLETNDFSIYDSFEHLGGSSFDRMRVLAKATANEILICADQFTPQTCLYDLWQRAGKEVNSISYLEQLLKELEGQIIVKHENKNPPPTKTPHYFVTGATGFLGLRVIAELLKKTDTNIYCLVRCVTKQEGRGRLINALELIDSSIEYGDRIKVLKGDVLEDYWGINEYDRTCLSNHVTKIFHCAAWISNMGSLDKMIKVNVKCLTYLFELMQSGCAKELHYASTLSVFVASDQKGGRCLEKEEIPGITKIYGAYAQSKWMAERLVFIGQKSLGLNVSVYRLGLLTGDSISGKAPSNDLLGMFLCAVSRLKIIPDSILDYAVDITPVDFAAQALIDISYSNKKGNTIYHIANPKSLNLEELVAAFNSNNIDVEIKSEGEFKELAKQNKEELLLTLINHDNKQLGLDLFQATGFQFDVSNSARALGGNYNCPSPTHALLKKYLDFYLEHV